MAVCGPCCEVVFPCWGPVVPRVEVQLELLAERGGGLVLPGGTL